MVAVGLVLEFLAATYGNVWLVLGAAGFLMLAGWGYTQRLVSQRKHIGWNVRAAIGLLVVAAMVGTYFFTKPKVGNPSKIAENTSSKPDLIVAEKSEPKDPSKKNLRRAIGDLIQRGTKIRDKAPVYVGETPGDIASEWKSWTQDVEKLLRGNFDAAEVAKFRSLNDPSKSLNSRIHYEIRDLENLLDRIGM